MAVDSNGNVYATDHSKNEIFEWNSSGVFVQTMGSPGTGPGQFESPAGVAVDRYGFVYAADQHNQNVQVFSSTGIFQYAINGASTPEALNTPEQVAVDYNGQVFVADNGAHQVDVFCPNASLWEGYWHNRLKPSGTPCGSCGSKNWW